MKKTRFSIGFLLVLTCIGCGGVSLPLPEKEVLDLVARMGSGDAADDATLAPDLESLNQILVDTFKGAYQPIPQSEMVVYDPVHPSGYSAIDAFRWGFGLPAYATDAASVGALVARPVSANYSTLLPLMVEGNWSTLFPTGFQTYKRVFSDNADQSLIDGTSDRAEADNHIVYKTSQGIIFEYDSHAVIRRIRDASLPSGEALLYWEQMSAPATNVNGEYNAHLDFLRNFHITIPFTDKLAWQFISGWNESGGSLFIFSAGASSGDVAEGIRADYVDLESYLTAQGLSCGEHCI